MSEDDVKRAIDEDIKYILMNENIPYYILYSTMIKIKRVANDYKGIKGIN